MVARMAGTSLSWSDEVKKRILFAVDLDVYKIEVVSARFAFDPQLVARRRPENANSPAPRLVDCLFVR